MSQTYTLTEAWEVSLLALCIWREGRDQSYLGKRAIGWTIRNRVFKPGFSWWGDDWEEVVLKPWQFSSFNPNDPNATKLPGDPKKDLVWGLCLDAAHDVFKNLTTDPTGGATHYYSPKMLVTPPKWVTAPGTKYLTTIGDHRFYKAN